MHSRGFLIVPDQPGLPPGWTLEPAERLQASRNFTLLVGGSPRTLVRLSATGGRTIKRLFSGEGLGQAPAERAMARRLEANGMATSKPPTDAVAADFSIVIPYYNDHAALERTLDYLASEPSGRCIKIVIVDDHSHRPLALTDDRDATVERLPVNLGPGAARNHGASLVDTDSVAFVDTGVEVSEKQLSTLVSYLSDPATVGVAPRVRPSPGMSETISAYETMASPLDLGPKAAVVKPLSPVSYVPSTCLVIDSQAFRDSGGFDEALRFGEDVDLVWRLATDGVVRYSPSVVVTHPARDSFTDFVKQRQNYGGSAALLALRHGATTTPLIVDRWSVAALSTTLAGAPLVALAITFYRSNTLAQALPDDLEARTTHAGITVLSGQYATANGLLKALARPYFPLMALSFLFAPQSVSTIAAMSAAHRLFKFRSLRLAGLSVADDAAYSTGVWQNAIKHRSWRCLIPRLL